MASCIGLFAVLVVVNGILVLRVDALGSSNETSRRELLLEFENYITESLKDISEERLNPTENTNMSIQYLLFTPDHPKTPCYLEPNPAALESCPFNSSLPFKFLVHGYLTRILTGGSFLMIKDEMLKIYKYNVIIVDWFNYNQQPYFAAAINTVLVGNQLANLIQFLQKSAGVDPKQIHLIGHSLGAHLSGVAGERTPDLGRITGLDPANRLFYPITLLHRLTYSDANFVDIIHSSNRTEGYGEYEPMGDLDFYPNGGYSQPQCQNVTNNFYFSRRDSCNHAAAVSYFMQSIDTSKCKFLATNCDSYSNFLNGLCSSDSSPIAEMGLPAKPISGLPSKSKFYLRTSPTTPYCLQDGYESPKSM